MKNAMRLYLLPVLLAVLLAGCERNTCTIESTPLVRLFTKGAIAYPLDRTFEPREVTIEPDGDGPFEAYVVIGPADDLVAQLNKGRPLAPQSYSARLSPGGQSKATVQVDKGKFLNVVVYNPQARHIDVRLKITTKTSFQ